MINSNANLIIISLSVNPFLFLPKIFHHHWFPQGTNIFLMISTLSVFWPHSLPCYLIFLSLISENFLDSLFQLISTFSCKIIMRWISPPKLIIHVFQIFFLSCFSLRYFFLYIMGNFLKILSYNALVFLKFIITWISGNSYFLIVLPPFFLKWTQ